MKDLNVKKIINYQLMSNQVQKIELLMILLILVFSNIRLIIS